MGPDLQYQIPELVSRAAYVFLRDDSRYDRGGIGAGTDDVLDVSPVDAADRDDRYPDGAGDFE